MITPLTTVKAIDGQTVATTHVMTTHEEQRAGVALVVWAYGGEATDALYHAAKQHVSDVHIIGDALAPRHLMDAILDGA